MKRFNLWLAEKITSGVATMWCAYVFAAIALISLPKALNSGDSITIVSWIAQTFLQLVLLSIIMVGQKAQSASVEKMISETHSAALEELKELQTLSKEIQALVKELDGKLPR
jgi:DNA integrity scanning protein DisA with diadenylate cyclase activity